MLPSNVQSTRINSPGVLPVLIIADDARLAAQVSCRFAPPANQYLAIVDGPRLTRPDADAEVIRRNNAAARIHAERIFFAGLPADAQQRLANILPASKTMAINTEADARTLVNAKLLTKPPVQWGRDRIGLGVLKALREGRLIEFNDSISDAVSIPSPSEHVVVCEAGNDISEVIAANYAFAMNAGLCIVPEIPRADADYILEEYYGLYDGQDTDFSQKLSDLQARLRAFYCHVRLPESASITFITRKLPAGVAFPEAPSTHLFSYPDLGLQIINGFAAELAGTRGANVAVLVDPGVADASEIDAVAEILPKRGMLVRVYKSGAATVRSVSEMIDLFPYDFLMFATHCGDAPGYRWTYKFKDSEQIDRTLVVDIALGIGQTEDPEILDVTQFLRFHSLDGVAWNDPHKSEKLHVGSTIADFVELKRSHGLEPVKKEIIARVKGSAAMKMTDNNILPISQSLACGGTPIVVNNACVSWHELASRFMFADARAYIGTLIPVLTTEAHEVIVKTIVDYAQNALPHALWLAQNEVYGSGSRRPYISTGVYPQRLRTEKRHAPSLVLRRLDSALKYWRERAASPDVDPKIKRIADYYDEEVKFVRRRWFQQE